MVILHITSFELHLSFNSSRRTRLVELLSSIAGRLPTPYPTEEHNYFAEKFKYITGVPTRVLHGDGVKIKNGYSQWLRSCSYPNSFKLASHLRLSVNVSWHAKTHSDFLRPRYNSFDNLRICYHYILMLPKGFLRLIQPFWRPIKTPTILTEIVSKFIQILLRIIKTHLDNAKTFQDSLGVCLVFQLMKWTKTIKQDEKFRCTQRGMERSILNTKKIDKIPNSKIRDKTKIEDAG